MIFAFYVGPTCNYVLNIYFVNTKISFFIIYKDQFFIYFAYKNISHNNFNKRHVCFNLLF
jgi:hypothetical protein